jgi:Gas vesicle synthesis protein GvpO
VAERVGLRRLGEKVLEDITALVGCPAEGVTGVRRDGEGYVVTVEVLEVGRVPQTTDVMATYEVHTDDAGDVMEFSRKRRYLRGQADE